MIVYDHDIWSHYYMGNIWSHYFIDGETMEIVRDFMFWGSKITADGDCSHEIKRCLLLGRKVMTNLDNMLKKLKHYFANKVHLIKATFFPVVLYECES